MFPINLCEMCSRPMLSIFIFALFLRFARCPSTGLARTVVQGHAMHTIHNSSDQMQGAHLAGTGPLFAIRTTKISAREIWNR